MTASTDKLVHIIDFNTAETVGTLKQGYKSMPNYRWEFPVSGYTSEQPQRVTRMHGILEEVRRERDKDLSFKKKKELQLLKAGRLNNKGFAGSQLMGMGGS